VPTRQTTTNGRILLSKATPSTLIKVKLTNSSKSHRINCLHNLHQYQDLHIQHLALTPQRVVHVRETDRILQSSERPLSYREGTRMTIEIGDI
jgi:hypothetical protein